MSKDEAEHTVNDILTRGVGTFIDPNDSFRNKLVKKALGEYSKEIVVKFGMDPTRPDIHLGHAVVLHKLRAMQDLGCKIIFLIGDFTTLIGDPTGKSKVRPELDFQTVSANMETYLTQVDKILLVDRNPDGSIKDSLRFSWMRNSDWFFGVTDISAEGASQQALTIQIGDAQSGHAITVPGSSFVGKAAVYENTRLQKTLLDRPATHGVSVVNLLWVLRHITYAQLIERDMFQERLKSNEPLFMHEMLYPVAQGIDSDVLSQIYGSCDLEVGGTDQTFNLLMGRKVMEMTGRDPQSILSFELLVGLDGKEKMSKSLDNYIAITDAPADMFGKVMSISDSALASYYELCTFTPMDEVKSLMKSLEAGKSHPKEVKMNLAEQIVETYHGRDAAQKARESFVNTFQNKEIPKDITALISKKGELLSDILVSARVVDSKSEFRRLVGEGAIRQDGEIKIEDPFFILNEKIVLKIGKHRFVEITPE